FLRKDHPLFSARLRLAARRGGQISRIHASDDDWLMPLHAQQLVAPAGFVGALAQVAVAVARAKGVSPPEALASIEPGAAAQCVAESLLRGERKAILLGNLAVQHPQASQLRALAHWIAQAVGGSCGDLTEAANTVGAYLAHAVPGAAGLNARSMLQQPRQAYVLLNVEPALDCADAAEADAALRAAAFVVALTPFKSAAAEHAHVMLPISPFTETSGTFINAEGRVQSFHGVVRPLGDTRPGWKVLRVLGNLLGVKGMEFDTSEAVRDELLNAVSIDERLKTSGEHAHTLQSIKVNAAPLQRVADVPIYAADILVRRAPALQMTADARAAVAALPTSLYRQLGLGENARVRVSSASGSVELPARASDALPADAVRVPAGLAETAALGPMFGALVVEKA
ncbi:MAG: molybdopterin-dependent oxidoreductase, partial [Betaproteobacteria bacterium]|nr:molybdopterin-dependent oxidoreductase [Betaproteobacteria bacterium]